MENIKPSSVVVYDYYDKGKHFKCFMQNITFGGFYKRAGPVKQHSGQNIVEFYSYRVN